MMNACKEDVASLVPGLGKMRGAAGADFALLVNLVQMNSVRYAWVAHFVFWVSLETRLIQSWNDMRDVVLWENLEQQLTLQRDVERNHLALWLI